MTIYPGLSPRGRGNRDGDVCGGQRQRSIPAWAGEPLHLRFFGMAIWVYPRVGGGTQAKRCTRPLPGGLSPRGRGNHQANGVGGHGDGSIPAWAGEPHIRPNLVSSKPVYPRVGGGTLARPCQKICVPGLSPRGRGNQARAVAS